MFDWCGNWNLPFTPEAEDLSPFSGGTALDLPWVEKKNFLIEPEVGVAVGAQQQMIVLCHKFEIFSGKFGPNCDLEVDNFLFFSKLSTSRSQFVGQILNSDLASSYFLFNTPTERSSKKNLVLKEKFGFSKKNLE